MGWRFNPISPCCGCEKGICFFGVGCCGSAPTGATAELWPHGADPEDDPIATCELAEPLTVAGLSCCVDLTDFAEGEYDWRVSAPGYATQTGTVTVMCGDNPTVVVHLCTASPVSTLTLTDPAGNAITLDYVPGSSTSCLDSGEGRYVGAHTYNNVTPTYVWNGDYGTGLSCSVNYPPEIRPVTVVYSYSCGTLSYVVTTMCFPGSFPPIPCVLIESPPEGVDLFCSGYGLTGFTHGGAETTDYTPCLPVAATWPYGLAGGVCCGVFGSGSGPAISEHTIMDLVYHPGGGSGGTFSVSE